MALLESVPQSKSINMNWVLPSPSVDSYGSKEIVKVVSSTSVPYVPLIKVALLSTVNVIV
jgi:hypothetical protein